MLGVVYKFIRQHYAHPKRLWPSAAQELWRLRCLLPLCQSKLSNNISPVVSTVDSCREQTDKGFGGYSVAEREWNIHDVVEATKWEERWRYKHRKTDDVVKPRQVVADYMLSPFCTPFFDDTQESEAVTLDPVVPSGFVLGRSST